MDTTPVTKAVQNTGLAKAPHRSILKSAISVLVCFLLASYFAFTQAPRSNPLTPPDFLEKLFKPDEDNAFLRLPSIPATINHVTTQPDSNSIWAAGNDGLIIQSIDGGEHWQHHAVTTTGEANRVEPDLEQASNKAPPAPPSAPSPVHFQAIHFSGPKTGWVVGSSGTILKTGDGGQSWRPAITATNAWLSAVGFYDARHGLVVGDFGTIWTSVDGGESWQPVSSGTTALLYSVSFIGADQAIAVGSAGTILKTIDGGDSWRQVSSGTDEALYSVTFTDAGHGVAVGLSGTILKTDDAGDSWQPIASGTSSALYSVSFDNHGHGITLGDSGTVLTTADGGRSWQSKSSGSGSTLRGAVFFDGSRSVVVGDSGTVLKTFDGGQSWLPMSSGATALFRTVTFIDTTQGIAVSDSGAIWKSADGGQSWIPKSSGANARVHAVTFIDADHGVAVGLSGTILKTVDGGDTWRSIANNTGTSLYSVAFVDADLGIAVGGSGSIMRTTDGGEVWRPVVSGTNEPLLSITFFDDDLGIAVGNAGTILKTADSGLSWQAISSGSNESLYSVEFIGDGRGIVAGSSGTILMTGDRGDSWRNISSGVNESLHDVTFFNTINGFAVGESGRILRSGDGGESWLPNASGTNAHLRAITFIDGDHAVAVGDGTILKTSDDGNSWQAVAYRFFPAIWYWAAIPFFVFVAIGWSRARPARKINTTETITDVFASDRPMRPGDPDPLGFAAIARGLSRFIRNRRTRPPLTVAITGEWGTGKSSLMNLLYHDVKQNGFSPVWFNAWHHQKGEQLLASLYSNIRSQVVPGWFAFSGSCPSGLLFRINLFFRRSNKQRLVSLIMITMFVTTLTYLFKHAYINGSAPGFLAEAFSESQTINNLTIALFGMLPPVAALIRSLRSFGINPASLIAMGSSAKHRYGAVDPSARQRFAQEFKDVTECLELGRMVIFIDDLDRCNKEVVVDILEMINFLSVSGDCYIILGMERDWVQTCIDQQFSEMAAGNPDFSRDYLEKLINIEIPVPALADQGFARLLVPEKPQEEACSAWNMVKYLAVSKFPKYRNLIVVCSLVLIGIFAGNNIDQWYKSGVKEDTSAVSSERKIWNMVEIEKFDFTNGQPSVSLRVTDTASRGENRIYDQGIQKQAWQLVLSANDEAMKNGIPFMKLGDESARAELLLRLARNESNTDPAKPSMPSGSVSDPLIASGQASKSSSSVEFRQGQSSQTRAPYLMPGLVLLFMMVSIAIFVLRKPNRILDDSPRFREALEVWRAWISLNRNTPRAIKRYLNRVRYIAMRYRENTSNEETPRSVLDKWFGHEPDQLPSENGFDEASIVALSAIFAIDESWVASDEKWAQICGEQLDALFVEKYPEQFSATGKAKVGPAPGEWSFKMQPLRESLRKHRELFGDSMFTNPALRHKFLDVSSATKIN